MRLLSSMDCCRQRSVAMPEPDKTRPARRHRWRIALFALVVVGSAAFLTVRHYTRPQQISAWLVAQAQSALGADLVIDGTGSFGFFPQLSVPRPTLKAHGAQGTLLRAQTLRAVVPWHTLWADSYDIERIELVKPTLDLDALNAWLAARPPTSVAPPKVHFALRVEDGTVTSAGKPVAQGLTIAFANSGDLAAWFASIGAGSLIPPLGGSADAATLQFGNTRLDDVHVELRSDDAKSGASQPP